VDYQVWQRETHNNAESICMSLYKSSVTEQFPKQGLEKGKMQGRKCGKEVP